MAKKKEVKKKKVPAEPVVYLRKYRCACGEEYEKDGATQDREVCPVCNDKAQRIG